MESKHFLIYAGVCAFLVFIGFLTFLGMMNYTDYYQTQAYNNLPSLTQEPAPIQHYKDKVDEANTLTEANNIVEKIPPNTTVEINNSTLFSNLAYVIVRKDGSFNIMFFVIWFGLAFWWKVGLFPRVLSFGIWTRGNIMASMIVSLPHAIVIWLILVWTNIIV